MFMGTKKVPRNKKGSYKSKLNSQSPDSNGSVIFCGTLWYWIAVIALYCLMWPCMALCGLVWPCLALFGLFWPCLALCGLIWSCCYFAFHCHGHVCTHRPIRLSMAFGKTVSFLTCDFQQLQLFKISRICLIMPCWRRKSEKPQIAQIRAPCNNTVRQKQNRYPLKNY